MIHLRAAAILAVLVIAGPVFASQRLYLSDLSVIGDKSADPAFAAPDNYSRLRISNPSSRIVVRYPYSHISINFPAEPLVDQYLLPRPVDPFSRLTINSMAAVAAADPPVSPATAINISPAVTRGAASAPPAPRQSAIFFLNNPGQEQIGPWKGGAGSLAGPEDPATDGALPVGSGIETELPTDQGRPGKIDGDIFYAYGVKGGYFHPLASLSAAYSDNIYSTKEGVGDFYTVFSPGIWLTLPSNMKEMVRVNSSSTAPGGLVMHRERAKSFRPIQAYLLYGADFQRFATHSEENTTKHRLEGYLQYNLRSGLAIDVLDQLIFSQDPRGTGISFELDEFKTNLLSTTVSYNLNDRFRLGMDYSSFLVDYDEVRNQARDRQDNSISGHLFYKLRSKTSASIEYELIDIDYQADLQSDSREHNFYGGLQWEITAKSKGNFKVGYEIKDFANPRLTNVNEYLVELRLDHTFSSKNAAKLIVLRRTNESTIDSSDYALANSINASLVHRFSTNLTGVLALSYVNEQYSGEVDFGGDKKALEDDIYTFSPALQYRLRKWLLGDIAYSQTVRNSSFSDLGYTNKLILVRISLIL